MVSLTTPLIPHTFGGMKKKKEFSKIYELAAQLQSLRRRATQLGMFVDDRELLSCAKCGLEEDVTIEGLLIVVQPSAPGSDTGFRFSPVGKSKRRYRCPQCKTILMCGNEA